MSTLLGPLWMLLASVRRSLPPDPADDGYCHCPEPVLDEDVAAMSVVGDDDLDADWCWRCQRSLPE